MAFTWPPIVSNNTDASSLGYFFSDVNDSLGGLFYNTGLSYYGFVEDHYAGENQVKAYSSVSATAGGISTGGTTLTGTDTGTLTTDDNVVLVGGDPGPGEDFRHCRSVDFTGDIAAWGTATTDVGDGAGFLLLNGQRWAATGFVAIGSAVSAVMGSATEWYCFVNYTGTAMMSQSLTGAYYRFNTATNTYDPLVELFSAGHAIYQILDAGEGYYYLITRNGSTVEIYGADMTGGTVSLTGVLASFANDVPIRTESTRYVNIGTDRVLGMATISQLITITYTAGTKATPTIASQAASLSGVSHYTVEYDPSDDTEAYIVGYATSGVGGGGWEITAAYSPVSDLSAGWQGAQVLTTVVGDNSGITLRAQAFGSAQSGSSVQTVGMQGYSQSFGGAYTISTRLQFWHVPVNHERNVNIVSNYTGASADVERIRTRNVEIDAASYGSVAAGVALGGAYGDTYEWELADTSEISVSVEIDAYAYGSVTADAALVVIQEQLPIQQFWPNMGYTFMDDFMVYLNQDRADVGLPPYKTYGKDGNFLDRRDMAIYHASQMGYLRIYAHDDAGFWDGHETYLLRGDRMPASALAENIQAYTTYDLEFQTNLGYRTAFEMFDAWHNSPPHYANITYNWGDDNDKIYSLLAVGDGWYPPAQSSSDWALFNYGCNIFVQLETLMFESDLQQSWDNAGATIALLDQEWANDSWDPVDAQWSFSYAIRVAAAHELAWGARVAAQHAAPITYRVLVSAEFPYTGTEFIAPAQNVFQYDIKDTIAVVEGHEAGYGMRVAGALALDYSLLGPVAGQNETVYDIKDTSPVAAQHETLYAFALSTSMELPFALLRALRASHEGPYDIKDTITVVKGHEVPSALVVSGQTEFGYAIALPVAQQNENPYDIKGTIAVVRGHTAPSALVVSASLETSYSLNTNAVRQHEAPYEGILQLVYQHEARFDMPSKDRILKTMEHYYSMEDYSSIFPASNVVTMTLPSGLVVRIDDGVISNDEGDAGYSFECSLSDLEVYIQVREDDEITVDFCGEVYTFIVDTKSVSRDSPSNISFRIAASNKTARLGSPYSQEIDFQQSDAALASAIIDSLVEIDFTYGIPDWTIPEGRLQVTGATPLEIVRQIVEVPGGTIDAGPDGDMRIILPYPVAMPKLGQATVDHTYTDAFDNLSVRQQTVYRDSATRIRIREGDISYSDSLVWVPDEQQPDPTQLQGIVKGYLSPYRANCKIVHLGNAVNVWSLGEDTEEITELVEFTDGVANVQRPLHSVESVEWYTASLGAPAYELYSTVLTSAGTNPQGYKHGLAKITYTTKHLTVRAVGVPANVESGTVGPASAYAYFVLEDSNA